MLRSTLAMGLLFMCSVTFAKEFNPYYYKITVKNGEAISTILSKYGLAAQEYHLNKFYKLNELNKKSKLIADKEYILPIKVYKYNGKSIRSTLKLEDVEAAKDIQKYNDLLLKKGLRKQSFLKNNLLWVPLYYVEGNKKELKEEVEKVAIPVKKEIKEESTKEIKKSPKISNEVKINELFGPKYREVDMFDNQLEGQVFFVSSGHGGPDPGAQCTDLERTLCEDEYAYDVALRLVRDLTQHGATVHMINQDENDGIRDEDFLDCDNDESCNGKDLPLRQLDRLKQRADHINRLYEKYRKKGIVKQTAIEIHVDSRNKEQRQDVFFYHYGSDKVSKNLAYNLQSTFEEKYALFQKGRGYKGFVANRGLYMLRKVKPSAVYVELANIRNKTDHIRLMESANRQALANWLFEGLTGIR